jgi:hypothetical protein
MSRSVPGHLNHPSFDSDCTNFVERMVQFEEAAVHPTVKPQEARETIRVCLTSGMPFKATVVIRALDRDVRSQRRRWEGSRPGRRTAAFEKHPSGGAQ